MSTLSLRLPESLHKKVKELAAQEDISINQFIATAVAEKMSALLTSEYLAERARRGSRAKFDRVLARVPDVEPDAGDEVVAATRPAKPGRRPQFAKARAGSPRRHRSHARPRA